LQLVNHAPETVGFAALDDLEGSRAVEGGVGVSEPWADGFGRKEFFQGGEETLDFGQAPGGRGTGLGTLGPVGHGAEGVGGNVQRRQPALSWRAR
jgi:hypothetical protein